MLGDNRYQGSDQIFELFLLRQWNTVCINFFASNLPLTWIRAWSWLFILLSTFYHVLGTVIWGDEGWRLSIINHQHVQQLHHLLLALYPNQPWPYTIAICYWIFDWCVNMLNVYIMKFTRINARFFWKITYSFSWSLQSFIAFESHGKIFEWCFWTRSQLNSPNVDVFM